MVFLLLAELDGCSRTSVPTLAFTVTPQPSSHNFHVVFKSQGGNGEMMDFTMPAWMPGYYDQHGQPQQQPAPLLVSGVAEGSPAQAAGLRPGDRLLTLDGVPATAPGLNGLLAQSHPGDKVDIGFERNGASQEIEVPVAPRETLAYTCGPRRIPIACRR